MVRAHTDDYRRAHVPSAAQEAVLKHIAGCRTAVLGGHKVGGNTVTIRMPALTALQLYFDGTLPGDRSRSVSIEVEGRNLGTFLVEWLRIAGEDLNSGPVLLRFRAVGASSTGTSD